MLSEAKHLWLLRSRAPKFHPRPWQTEENDLRFFAPLRMTAVKCGPVMLS